MGLHPGNGFACAVNFLLRLRPEALAPHQAELQALERPGALTIGIQIRTGDAILSSRQDVPIAMDKYLAFFDCAEQIATVQRLAADQPVYYYLVSDSLALRRAALAAFPDHVISSMLPIHHVRVMDGPGTPPDPVAALQGAAAEMWLFGLADFHVVSTYSGYGRLGALMGGKWHNMYAIELPHNSAGPAPNRTCSPQDYASTEHLSDNSTKWLIGGVHRNRSVPSRTTLLASTKGQRMMDWSNDEPFW